MALSSSLLQSLDTNEQLLSKQLILDVKEIFSTMVGLKDLLHLPIQMYQATSFKDCISALVGLAGVYNGLVSLHIPSDLAIRITSLMLDMEVSEVNDDVNDAMGEITNMVAGSFKQHLSRSGLDVHLSTPSVVHGNDYMITLGSNPDRIAVRFATEDNWFMVAVAFESS